MGRSSHYVPLATRAAITEKGDHVRGCLRKYGISIPQFVPDGSFDPAAPRGYLD